MRSRQYIVLPDVHAPWHNKPLLKKICQLIEDIRPYGIVFSGDFLDLYSIASHTRGKDIGGLNLSKEYESGRSVMDDLLTAGRRAKDRHFLYGNHEDRFLRWKQDSENAKTGNTVESPEEALRLRERGFNVLINWKDHSVRLGEHLEVVHGQWCGRNPCRTHLDNYEGSIMFGHTHGFGSIVTGRRGSFNIGYLGDKMAAGFQYEPLARRRHWTNAFAVPTIMDNGEYHAQPVQVWADRFIFNGKVY